MTSFQFRHLLIPFISLAILIPVAAASAETLHLGKFSTNDLSGWTDKKFKGKTSYALVQDGDQTVLKAHSVKGASGLLKKVNLDAKKFPILRWSWKVDNLIIKEDISKKTGDDFSARVYVVFPKSFWRMRAITYVWAAKTPKESTHPSPYTANAMIIAVESGSEKVGQWVKEERNILEDYRKLFGEDPPEIGAVALMSDTDDTLEEVTAYYGDIYLAEKDGVQKEQKEGREKPALPATNINR